jgi:hypothetical protein
LPPRGNKTVVARPLYFRQAENFRNKAMKIYLISMTYGSKVGSRPNRVTDVMCPKSETPQLLNVKNGARPKVADRRGPTSRSSGVAWRHHLVAVPWYGLSVTSLKELSGTPWPQSITERERTAATGRSGSHAVLSRVNIDDTATP